MWLKISASTDNTASHADDFSGLTKLSFYINISSGYVPCSVVRGDRGDMSALRQDIRLSSQRRWARRGDGCEEDDSLKQEGDEAVDGEIKEKADLILAADVS
jgi:hypothetical protein